MSKGLGEILDERYKGSVSFVQLDSDIGVAEQRNIGFVNSSKDSEYVLFLDNDTEVEAHAIERLTLAAEQDPEFSILQPRIVSYSDRRKTLEIGLTSNLFGIPKPNRNVTVEPFFASGSGMLVRRDVMSANGGFDPVFFFGAEELDLVWRARLIGHRIKAVPEALVYHKTEGTRKRLSANRLYLGLRNTARMQLKNYSCPLNLLIAHLFLARVIVESVLLSLVSKMSGYSGSNVASIAMVQNNVPDLIRKFVSAISWNLRNLKDTIVQHAIIQSIRTVPDKAILSAFKKSDLIFLSPAYRSDL
jgi:GT2 family glycosyltransferase